MGHHAVQAVVGSAGGGDDHLAIALGEARVLFEHQGIVVGKKRPPFGRAACQGQKNVGYKAGLTLDFEHFGANILGQILEFGGGVAAHDGSFLSLG